MWILNGLVPNTRTAGSSTRVGDGPLTETRSDMSRSIATRVGSDEPFTKAQIDSGPEWPAGLSVRAGSLFASRPAGDQGETRKESDLSSRTRMG